MIGVFDSGHGGLTVLRALAARFPHETFLYYGDHANAPYGSRSSKEIVRLTQAAVQTLFEAGCRLVVLGCNTATCVAARTLQIDWLRGSPLRQHHNLLGIVAPTVEAATQTPWGLTTPQYPQKYNTDVIAIFGTERTIASGVYPEEIRKRCPKVRVVQQVCSELAGAIEADAGPHRLEVLVRGGVESLLAQTEGQPPHRAILGCTHFPLVEPLFRRHLPAFTRLLSQPDVVADSLEDYLVRHPRFVTQTAMAQPSLRLLTSGRPAAVSALARVFWPDCPPFEPLAA